MGRGRSLPLTVAALIGALLGVPAVAQGTVTIGSNLGRAPEGIASSFGCSPPCTLLQTTLAGDRQAPGGLVSPVNGTVVLWRIRAAADTTPTALRVIKPLTAGLWLGAGRSTSVTPAANALSTFQTQLPITIGDSIGIDCCQPDAEYFLLSGGTETHWGPPGLPEGGPGTPDAPVGGPHEIALNADVEPTSGFTIAKHKAKKGGAVTLTVQLPNPGTIVAENPGKKGLVKRASTEVGPGSISITVPVKKAARGLLAERGHLTLKVKLVYTPTGGSPSTQTSKIKLRR